VTVCYSTWFAADVAEGQIRVHLYGHPCDMRESFPGLYALTVQGLREAPLSGDLFVISRRATQTKILYFDRSGFCIWAKRLEAGRFVSDWARVRTHEMDWTGFVTDRHIGARR
jgi:transposase